jgi:uncharacterized membrane protein YjgN (DUF898 family)
VDVSAATILGSALTIVGVVLVIVQIMRRGFSTQMRGGSFGPKGFAVRTTYPGLILIVIGAVLVILGE